jgi:hypothetical protein
VRVFVGSAGKFRDLARRVAEQLKQQARDRRPCSGRLAWR